MSVKQQLHQIVEQLSEDPDEDERRVFYQRLFGLVLPPRELTATDRAALTEQSSLEIVDASEAAEALTAGPGERWGRTLSALAVGLRTSFADAERSPEVAHRINELIDSLPGKSIDEQQAIIEKACDLASTLRSR